MERGARRDRFSARDLVAEAAHGIGARPGRLVLTILGTVLGIGSVVVTVGLAQTAAGQIGAQFDAVSATQVSVAPKTSGGSMGGTTRALTRLPWDAPERVLRLNGVEEAGLVASVAIGDVDITAVPVNDPSAARPTSPQVLATSGHLLEAVRGEVTAGRYFDDGHGERGDRVVVLGERAAEKLGVTRVESQPSIFIGEDSYTVIGIVSGMARRADMLDAVIMPMGTARADFDLARADELQIRIATGAGPLVKQQAPVALDPNAPENFTVKAPPNRSELRQNVQADVNAIFLALGGVALLVGGLGIANVTLLSVMERRGEIGLRRALGATRRDIAGQFVVESVVIGLLGGLIGAAIGVFVVVGVSAAKDWTAILDLRIALGSALLGGVIGLVAGTYPALKAAAIEPITALRGGI
ncbi:ABC transporter permease [Sanguibacter suaedae]|uniref:ABC transporter permease n=1 Tax=Sanguibacter suaedae TaxID=2795737 RepID=A0A934IA64_9MICO|nr:ABC transporter permease [Sanguibacter suaedae]MBI9114173.1 ABC transporter permease [Sanguibacter suaedae]